MLLFIYSPLKSKVYKVMNEDFLLEHYMVYPKHNKIISENKVTILEPKIIQVLCFLVQHQGEVLSREYIADNLWPDNVVGLKVITRAIFELRKVLNDDPKKPKYIETIARKGYCFIGKVEPLNTAQNRPYFPLSFLSKPNIKNVAVSVSLLFIFTFFLFVGPTTLLDNFQSSATKPVSYQEMVLSDGRTEIQSASLSADGSKVLFIETDTNTDESVLVLKNVVNHKYSILQRSNDVYRSVIWAEQGNVSYFVQCEISTCKINKLFIDSGILQEVYKTKNKIRTIKLSPKGKTLALTTIESQRLSISLLPLISQQETPLKLVENASYYAATFSKIKPELFYVQQSDAQSTINSYNLETTNSTVISTRFSKITSLHLEDDNSLLIAGQLDSLYSIWRLNLQKNEVSQAILIPASSHAYELTSNKASQEFFYLKKSSNINIAAQGLTQHIDLKQVNSHANDLNGVWSTSTSTLYFVSQRTGNYELWSHKNNKNTKLTGVKADSIRRPILNKQQNLLAFVASQNNQLKLMIYNIDTEHLIVNQNISKEAHLLSWSAEGNYIYMSIASENLYDIWQFDIDSKQPKKILLSAGLIAKQQTNNDLIFADIKSQNLMLKKPDGVMSIIKSFKGIALQFRPHSIKINNKSDHLYYVEKKPKSIQVMSTALSEMVKHKPKKLFTLTTNDYVTDIGLHGEDYVIYDHFVSKSSQLLLLRAVN